MKWRTKSGEVISGREFMSRWKKGIEKVSLVQQVKMQLIFTWMTILGIFCGIAVAVFAWKTLWWLFIILVAALGNTIVGLIGAYQKYIQLKKIEEAIRNEHNGL